MSLPVEPSQQRGGEGMQQRVSPTLIKTCCNKKALKLALLAISIGLATNAKSEVIEYSFIDTSGASKVVDPTATYVNPKSQLVMSLSGGLDRKVRASILNPDGSLAASITSTKITASDKRTYTKGVFYSKDLIFNALSDGNYTVKAEILDMANNPVQTDSYSLIIDTTAPVVGSFYNTSYANGASGLLSSSSVVNYFENDLLWATVDEQGSGIDSVRFYGLNAASEAQSLPNNPISSVAAKFTSDEKKAYLGDITTVEGRKKSHMFAQQSGLPNITENVILQFTVKDKAGNVGYGRQQVLLDNKPTYPAIPFAVYNPNYTGNDVPGTPAIYNGYELYKPGMKVFENPIRFLYQVPANDWYDNNNLTGWYFPGRFANAVIANASKSDYTFNGNEYKLLTITKSTRGYAEIKENQDIRSVT